MSIALMIVLLRCNSLDAGRSSAMRRFLLFVELFKQVKTCYCTVILRSLVGVLSCAVFFLFVELF